MGLLIRVGCDLDFNYKWRISIKKMLLVLATTSIFALANDTTVNATMGLMTEGLQQVQTGFVNNNKDEVVAGIAILDSANAIFSTVDVSTFIPNNRKVKVTKNISENFTTNIKKLKKAVEASDYTTATKQYGRVISNCMACHKAVRKLSYIIFPTLE